jgi:hypothetical protein
MDATACLLATAFCHVINEPNIEAGYARFAALTAQVVGLDSFCDAVAECLHGGLIQEPIRLPEGSLQCHWHLKLTPAGVAVARQLLGSDAYKQDARESSLSC